MPTVAELTAKVSIDSANFDAGLRRANTGMDTLAKNTKAKLSQSTEAFQRFGNEIRPVLTGVGIALAAALGFSIKKAVDFDSLKRGLTAVAGSAQEAEKQLVRLKEVAKLPGLGFEEAIRGSINLQAAGVQAQLAEKALMGFGNALATVGRGKAELDGVIVALTQMSAKGKIMAQEINQIAERVPQIRKVLQDAFGTSSAEEIQNMGLTFEQFLSKVTVELDKITKVTGGSRNSLENLMDAVNQAAAAMGDVFLPTVEAAAAAISQLAAAFVALPQPMQSAIGWITAATLGLGLLGVATVKAVQIFKAFRELLLTFPMGRFSVLLRGLAATLGGPVVVAAGAAVVGFTIAETVLAKYTATAEKARGEMMRVSAIFMGEVHNALNAAAGDVEKLTAFWRLMQDTFGKTRVPTAIVEGLRIELGRLGHKLTETGQIAKQAFAEMSAAAKDAMDSFRDATLAIGWRAQSGATDRLGALKEQLSATSAAINKITDEMVLPQGVSAEEFLAAAERKKAAEIELQRLIGVKKKIEADILKIERDSETSKQRQADWLRQQEDAAQRLKDATQSIANIIEDDIMNRDWADRGLFFDMLTPLEAAQAKLQSINQAIEALYRQPKSSTENEEKIQERLLKLLVFRGKALIQVAAAEKVLEAATKARGLADFYAARAQKQFIENVMGLAKVVSHAMTQSFAMAREAEHIAVAEMAVANAINAVKFALQSVAPIVKEVGDKLKKQGENFNRYILELNIKLIGLTKGATAAAKAALMLNDGLTSGQADAVLALQKIVSQMEDMRRLAEDLATGIADAFLNGLRRVREEGFAGLLRSFEEMLFDMAMAFLRSQLVNMLTSFFSNLLGAAVGGGSGSSGSGGIQMYAPNSNSGNGFGGGDFGGNMATVVNNFYITTPDANSFRQSSAQQQIAALQLATANTMRTR